MELRASTKTVQVGWFFSLAVAILIVAYIVIDEDPSQRRWILLGFPLLLALLNAYRFSQRRLVKLTVLPDRLRYEAGLLSKTTRTMELAKIQDVRVDQTLGQRLLGTGDLSIETAGGASRIVIHSIDNPQSAADKILELARDWNSMQ